MIWMLMKLQAWMSRPLYDDEWKEELKRLRREQDGEERD
jgi:hypothetical protein